MADYHIRISGDAALSIEQIAKITERDSVQVISDALKIYEWLLKCQTEGMKIVASNEGSNNEEYELENLIKNRSIARSHFI